MKTKVFIDGSEGTTGLRINERFQNREDIEILTIAPELRKDNNERKKFINASDITFLCLPDEAAKEAVALVENENVRIIDASTAHRTEEGWAYGLPELSEEFRRAIQTGKRISVPGCYPTGLISMCYPLVSGGILPASYPVVTYAISGYSGAGKKVIAQYEEEDRASELDAPRIYGLTQQHKHVKEMQKISGLAAPPVFTPIICDYYSGMVVCLPLHSSMLTGNQTPETIQKYLTEYYSGQKFIRVMEFGKEAETNGFLSGNARSGWDGLDIYVTGNPERIQISACFDNLGKGASGAAIQCMNIMLGCDEAKGLSL